MQFYDGIPVGICDLLSGAKTVGMSSDCSTVYPVQLGEGALSSLTSPGGLQVERVGSLETKGAKRTRVKWYVSLALFNTLKLAKLIGVRPQTPPRFIEKRAPAFWRGLLICGVRARCYLTRRRR
jgi:hypothetical protein